MMSKCKKRVFRVVALCLMLVLLFAGTALAVSAQVTVDRGLKGKEVNAGSYAVGKYIWASIASNSADCYLSLQLYTSQGMQNIARTSRVSLYPSCGGNVPAEGTLTSVPCTLLIVNEGEVSTSVVYSVDRKSVV